MQVLSTLWTHSFFLNLFFFYICFFFLPSGYQRKTTKNPKSSKALRLHLGIKIFYIAAPEIYFHHQVSAARYWAHSHRCNPFATASTSLPASPRHTGTAGPQREAASSRHLFHHPANTWIQPLNTTARQVSLSLLQVGISNIKEWSRFRQQGR